MELSSQMILFAQVVEYGSFSAAARALGHAPSAVSRQVGALEDRLGVRLLHRGRQGLALTEAGTAFRDRATDVARRVAEAEAEAMAMGSRPLGVLRVACTTAFGRTHLMPILPPFLAANPELGVSLTLSDQPTDIAAEGIDVAIRFSEQIDDSSVVSRRLAQNRRVICAAPDYLRRAGVPSSPEEVERHNCLTLSTVPLWNEWHYGPPGDETIVRASGDFESNSADAIYHAALAGLGIARLPTYLVAADLRAGRPVHLLPDLVDEATSIVAVYAERRNLPLKIRAFIDHVAGVFSGTPPWDEPR